MGGACGAQAGWCNSAQGTSCQNPPAPSSGYCLLAYDASECVAREVAIDDSASQRQPSKPRPFLGTHRIWLDLP